MDCPFGFFIRKNRVNTLALLKPCIKLSRDFWDVRAICLQGNMQRHLGSTDWVLPPPHSKPLCVSIDVLPLVILSLIKVSRKLGDYIDKTILRNREIIS